MTTPFRGVRWVADLIHPYGYQKGWTIVLRAYLDASNEGARDPCVVVAGFVADTPNWQQFEDLWRPFLAEYELKRFHSFRFWERRDEFQPWSDAKWEAARLRVGKIISELDPKPIGVGCAIALQPFEEWRHQQARFVDPDPYYFCLDTCLHTLIRGVTQHPVDEGIAIYIDQDKERERLGEKIAEWHQERLKYLPVINPKIKPDRAVTIHYVPSTVVEYCPLHLADILANGTFRRMKGFLQTGDINSNCPYFIECVEKSKWSIGMHLLYDIELIDIQSRAKFHADDPW